MNVRIKRAYEEPAMDDGYRVLVDRMWPRGVRKDQARLDAWFREVGPSNELRKWFGHQESRWAEFKKRYFQELDQNPEGLDELIAKARDQQVTLVYAASDREHNNAVALREFLQKRLQDTP